MNLKELYQEIILEHGKNPRNLRKTENFNKDAKGNNPLCGAGVGKGTDKWRQHHIKQSEHGDQGGALPFGATRGFDHFNRHHKQGVVSQRAEKLGRHDGVKTAFHVWRWPFAGYITLCYRQYQWADIQEHLWLPMLERLLELILAFEVYNNPKVCHRKDPLYHFLKYQSHGN